MHLNSSLRQRISRDVSKLIIIFIIIYCMNRWGNRQQEEPEGLNLPQIVNSTPSAYQLLQISNLPEEVKSKSTQFTQLLIQPNKKQLLFELIRVAVNPTSYLVSTGQVVTREMAHAAIEILTNLSEQFMESIFEGEAAHQDEVIQIQKEYPVLSHMFKVMSPGQMEETGLAYLVKILTPFLYQRPEEMIRFINDKALQTIVNFFWSPSMAELAGKVLEAQSEKDFYESEKVKFVRQLCTKVSSITDESQLEQTIQNFGELLESIVQKHEDRYEKTKYSNLIRTLMAESFQDFAFLLNVLETYSKNSTIKSEVLHCIEAILRIHETAKPGSKIHEQEQNIEPIELVPEFKEHLLVYLQKHPVKEFVSDRNLELLNYYKVLKKLLTIAPELAEEVLTKQLLEQTLQIMKEQANNNILHNFQKDLLISGIKNSTKVCSILKDQLGLDDSLRSNLSAANSTLSYQHQLFLIGEAVSSQDGNNFSTKWSDLEEPLKQKRAFYSVVIGGNPRGNNQKWSSFQDDFILKPLERNNQMEEKDTQQTTQEEKKKERSAYVMVTRLDELEGTQVLSQDEDEPFSGQKEKNSNSHYFDDVGMPELPLDSDRSEDDSKHQLNSLEQLPASLSGAQKCLKTSEQRQEESGENMDDFPLQLKENSFQKEKKSGELKVIPNTVERVNSIITIDLGETAQQNWEPLPQIQITSPNSFQQQQPCFSKSSKPESNFIENEINQLTVSVNISDEETSQEIKITTDPKEEKREQKVSVQLKSDDQSLRPFVAAKQQLPASEQTKQSSSSQFTACLQQISLLLLNRYNLSLHQ